MKYVWVLNWRIEYEANSNQTEDVYPEVFVKRRDAVRFAQTILTRQRREWGFDKKDDHEECHLLLLALSRELSRVSYLFNLSDADNLVFELSRKKVR